MTYKNIFEKSYNFYKNDIEENYTNTYEFIDFSYEIDKSKNRNHGVITVKHKVCDNTFKRVAAAWKTNKSCQYCSNIRSVSLLHAVMSCYAKRLFNNCENEYDIGFTGENDGVSKYDLFIPEYKGNKTLFEFQSKYHDHKKGFDAEKKFFAENLGYTVIQLDCREITPVDAVCIYFGMKISLEDIYKNNDFIRDHDFRKVQSLLDENLSVSIVSDITGISKNVIHHGLAVGLLLPKENRKSVLYGKTPIVQLDLSGNFIRYFDSGWQAYKELGFKVESCVSGKTRHSHQYLFIKREDYEKGNYTIPSKIRIFNKN